MNGNLNNKLNSYPGMSYLTFISLGIVLFLSCKGGTKNKESEAPPAAPAANIIAETPKQVKSIQITSPLKGDTCLFNQELTISYANNKRFPVDSVHLFYNRTRIATMDSTTRTFTFKIPAEKCGTNTIKIIAYHPNGREGSAIQSFVVKPDKKPRRLTHEIIKTYEHDPKASTQGLLYHEGYIYESTGIRGESTLRKTDLNTNTIMAMHKLKNELFGEGVTIYDDKIYQITWTSRIGFVYDLRTFREESTFHYQTHGWGITTMDNKLVMSDGTHQLHHLSPKGFDKIKTVEVYDNNGPVIQLNELEYINGYIWANVWLTDRIVIIDPETGAVVEELYLPNMLTPAEKSQIDLKEDVLNGIAYNQEKGTIYVTGKHWPKLFELKVK